MSRLSMKLYRVCYRYRGRKDTQDVLAKRAGYAIRHVQDIKPLADVYDVYQVPYPSKRA